MKPALIDTDVLSRFFRGHGQVVKRFGDYTAQYGTVAFSIVTYYEILSGLRHRDARRQLDSFLAFSQGNDILPLSREAADRASELYAETRKAGTPVDDMDILIAGIALAHGRIVVTCNTEHFNKLPGLIVEDWTL
jgi:tRNA(fMet)-specific endonuclease VapC